MCERCELRLSKKHQREKNSAPNRNLHLNTAQKQVVAPLIGETVLPQYSRYLSPVPNVVQKKVRCDLVLACRDEAGGESLEGENSIELRLGRRRQKVYELPARLVAQLEHILDGSLAEILPLGDFLVEKPLRVAQLHRENVRDDSADCGHAPRRKWNRPGFRVLDEPVVPPVVLRRRELEEGVVPQSTAVGGAHTRR